MTSKTLVNDAYKSAIEIGHKLVKMHADEMNLVQGKIKAYE